jgi:hypothetical protein
MIELNKEELLSQHHLHAEQYVKLLNDKQVLTEWAKPQLEALYTSKIGHWQVERLRVQLQVKALKLKIELVQASINRNEEIDINDVELAVAAELADAELRIMKEVTKVEYAQQLLSNLDTPERSNELRKLFRKLAKQLHPDVNSSLSEQQVELWHKILAAYNTGDVEKMKALEVVYENEITSAAKQLEDLSLDELATRVEVLKQGIRCIEAEISKLRQEFPFNVEKQIKDEEWVNKELERIHAELEDLRSYEEELTAKYQQLISTL